MSFCDQHCLVIKHLLLTTALQMKEGVGVAGAEAEEEAATRLAPVLGSEPRPEPRRLLTLRRSWRAFARAFLGVHSWPRSSDKPVVEKRGVRRTRTATTFV